MGEPQECGKEFEVSGSGATRDEAKQKAQDNADGACRRLNKGCRNAQEAGTGTFKESAGVVTYISLYVCVGI